MSTQILSLEDAGATKDGRAFDVFTQNGKFAGLICEHYGKHVRVYFNSNASRGSAIKFKSVPAAAEYIINRRIKKGWGF